MISNIKILISFLFFNLHIVNCQISNITNIDTSYLQVKFAKNNLSVNIFRNGDSIYKAESIEDFYEKWYDGIDPAYFVINKNGVQNYFYNWEAVSDSRNLAPYGFSIPSPLDFEKTNEQDCARFSCIGFLDNELHFSDNQLIYYWTNNRISSSIRDAEAFFYDNKTLDKSSKYPMHRSYGLNVRCIENIEEIIKDSVFNYKLLLPNEFKQIGEYISPLIFNGKTIGNNFKIALSGNFETNKKGEISISSLSLLSKDLKLENLESNVESFLKSAITIPYYKGNILLSKANINFIFSGVVNENKNTVFNSIYFEGGILENDSLLQYAFDNGFKVSTQTFEIFDGKESINKSINLYDFKASGAVNSIGCLLPGLGMSLLTKNCNYNCGKRKGLANSLLASSISLGLISISSKIYSNYYYNRYLNDLYGYNAEKNYKNASVSQKIFLSSLIGYGILGAVDFCFTFSLGSKNKINQLCLNKRIKKGEQIIIR